jgi:hypothetical protein
MPTKKETVLSSLEEKKLEAKIAEAKDEILTGREHTSAIKDYYKTEGLKRYRCIVTSSRKGEKTFEMFVENPSDTNKPVKLNGKLGVELKDGLPMYAIQRLEEAYDLVAEESAINQDPNVVSQKTFSTNKMPRYNVRVLGEVENPKRLGSKAKKVS